MPEGDSLFRMANRLRPALAGRPMLRFEAPTLRGRRPRVGETIDSVDAVGKYLLIEFSGGLTVATHLRMTGSWHLYAADERWRKPPHLLRVGVWVPDAVAVCFSAPVVRSFVTAHAGSADDPTARLGPDLCTAVGSTPEAIDVVLSNMAAVAGDDPDRTIGEVLLKQQVAAGIGNIYKSEVCWRERVNPFTPVGDLSVDVRRDLIESAAALLQANLGTGRRETVPGGLAVYGLRGRPCRRCGTAIRSTPSDGTNRVTYWCPTCQPKGT